MVSEYSDGDNNYEVNKNKLVITISRIIIRGDKNTRKSDNFKKIFVKCAFVPVWLIVDLKSDCTFWLKTLRWS